MSERGGRALVAPLARRRIKLESKGKVRSHKKMSKRLPAGSGDLASVPKGKDYADGKSGGIDDRGVLQGGARQHAGVQGVAQGRVDRGRARHVHATHQLLDRAKRVWHIRRAARRSRWQVANSSRCSGCDHG